MFRVSHIEIQVLGRQKRLLHSYRGMTEKLSY